MQQQHLPLPLQFAEVASWNRFSQVSQVRAAVAEYIERLRGTAGERTDGGRCPVDGDHPVEVLSFLPPAPSGLPIILIGGMGPLAGAVAFDLACQYFGDSREIVLYQACGIPNRVTVMRSPHRIIHGLRLDRYLVEGVSGAIAGATQYLRINSAGVIAILLCNAVHYYLPQIKADLQKRYPKLAFSIQYISLVEAVMAEMEKRKLHKPLLLGTSATRMGKVYSAPLEERGIEYQQLSEVAQEILMSAIYQGVKAFNRDYACLKGEELFNSFSNAFLEQALDCVIAGCTEIPILLDWLQAPSQVDSIQRFLTRVTVINPVRAAFEWIGDREDLATRKP